MQTGAEQPILIFGGFLSFPMLYNEMRQALHELTGQQVSIVPTRSYDWLGIVTLIGASRLLQKLDQAVRAALAHSSASKITLVCHSAGGVLARLYLSPQPFAGHSYRGLEKVSRLITLGSPHHNQGGLTRGGRISRYADRHCPGACHCNRVDYTTVAGKSLHGSLLTTTQARLAYNVYQDLCGEGDVWGDGVVPLQSAMLEGARQIVLEGVRHSNLTGGPWYGSREIVPQWWLD